MHSINPKISIVTPSFNQGQYIEDTIQSVLKQNYENYEHIIIDGKSTDNTIAILNKYPHLVWVSEPDQGQSDALNKGFKKATSEWVIWLNADDILLPGSIKKYADSITKNPIADVIHGHMQFFMDGTSTIAKRQYFNNFSRLKIIFKVVIPPTTGTLFRTKILLENPLNLAYHYMMDGEWYMRCSNFINVLRINDFLVKFRISSSNKTSVQILTGKQNKQQDYEAQELYNTYTVPFLENLPKKFQKIYFNVIRFFLININRIQKLKYYLNSIN